MNIKQGEDQENEDDQGNADEDTVEAEAVIAEENRAEEGEAAEAEADLAAQAGIHFDAIQKKKHECAMHGACLYLSSR